MKGCLGTAAPVSAASVGEHDDDDDIEAQLSKLSRRPEQSAAAAAADPPISCASKKSDIPCKNEKLRSADLFSGLGLHAFWSQSFAQPTVFCEIDKSARSILLSAMHRGLIPTAPVHPDVLDLTVEEGVSFITGSWPCQGNSICGKRKGMEDERSALINRVMEIAHKVKPAILFIENVPPALKTTMRLLLDEMKAGYDLSWCCLGAQDVGLPHERNRFFCLLIRRDEEAVGQLRYALEQSEAHQVAAWPEPRRMVAATSRLNTIRCSALGNAISPGAAKKAFELMGRTLLDRETKRAPIIEQADLRPWGLCLDGQEYHTRPEVFNSVNAGLVFDPAAYCPPPDYKPKKSRLKEENLLTASVPKKLWPTPRHANTGSCHYLTSRSIRDLGTVLRFEAGTPKEDRGGVPDAKWLEWLMGIPAGYTDEACFDDVKTTLVLKQKPAPAA